MKRFFLYAMMAAGVLASCSQSENDGALPGGNPANPESDAMPIMISAVAPLASVSASTRSTGTVGGVGDGQNVWSGQELHIFAFQKDADTGITYGDKIMNDKETFYDKVGIAKENNSVAVEWKAGGILYFPRSGAYDFFGYYADDALTSTNYTAENNSLYGNFEIDGSQDLMIAKAKLLGTESLEEADKNKAYSAYTARKGVQPSMTFEHQLTRLVFNVKGMGKAENNDKPENVYVKEISVLSKATGKLVFAYVENPGAETAKGAIFDASPAVDLFLQEKNAEGKMQPLDNGIVIDEANLPVTQAEFEQAGGKIGNYPASALNADATRVGEALLVEPNVEEYIIKVKVVQYYHKDGSLITDEKDRKYTYTLPLNIKQVTPPAGVQKTDKFLASSSYNITIQVYAATDISLTAVLGEWKDGGDITLNPDDDFIK
ncbi:fimbrillin family protein [Bacteroides congonensis]